jgi:uncharacterized protein DUF5675
MQILVTRDRVTTLSTTSKVTVDGAGFGYGLEPAEPIPCGEYPCWLRWSDANKHWVIAVMDVPGHTDIEVHSGNVPKDTKCCLLPGLWRGPDVVAESRKAFLQLLEAIKNRIPAEKVTIKYVYAEGVHPNVHNATA